MIFWSVFRGRNLSPSERRIVMAEGSQLRQSAFVAIHVNNAMGDGAVRKAGGSKAVGRQNFCPSERSAQQPHWHYHNCNRPSVVP